MNMISLETKITPPSYLRSSSAAKSAQPKWIRRTRLIDQLEAVREGEAVFLTSPNGSGKTTLIQSWLIPAVQGTAVPWIDEEEREKKFPIVGWLTLDQGDNDPVRFLTGLITALHQHKPGFGAMVLDSLQAPRPPEILQETANLLHEITQIEQPITLILDEYEAISSARLHQGVLFLLSHLPQNLRLVIASETNPPPELEKACQEKNHRRMTFQDLRLTKSEAAELLAFYSRKSINDQQAEVLLDRTQGMAYAVQLAGTALYRHPDPEIFWQDLRQQTGPALGFLLDHLLHRQMESVREFLLCTSILSRLTGPLCDMVMRASPSGLQASERGKATLEYLSKNRLFTSVMDRSHAWYRYHPAFAHLLVNKLNETHPAVVCALHQRASYWFEVNEDIEGAIAHALACEDEERASVLIETHIMSLVGEGQLHTALTWLGKLSAGLILLRPWLSLAEAWATAHEGWKEGVETLLANVDTATASMASPAAQRARGHMAAIRSQIALKDEDTERMEELCRQALELLPPQDRTIRSHIASQLGLSLRRRGQLTSAAEAFSEAISCTNQGQNRSATIQSFSFLSDLHFIQGLFQKVLALSEEAIHFAETHRGLEGQILPHSGLVHLFSGLVLLERDELDLAQDHLENGLEHCKALGKWDGVSMIYAALASLQHARGDPDEARQSVSASINSLARFLEGRTLLPASANRFLALRPERIEAKLVRLQASRGEWQAVGEWLDRYGYSPEDAFTFAQMPIYLALTQVLLTQGRILEARRLVRRLVQSSENAGAIYNLVQTLVLQASISQVAQDYPGALASLRRALQLAETEKMIRVFMDDTGSPTSTSTSDLNLLIRRISEGGPGSAHARVVLSALEKQGLRASGRTFSTGIPAVPVTHPLSSLEESRTESFTEREKLILRYLESYLSLVDIASQLSVSPRTVDTLLRNLFRKLRVSEAEEAVQRARELRII